MRDIVVKRNSFLVLLIVLAVSCKRIPVELEDKEYVQWVENSENGLSVTKQVGDFEFLVLYKPLDYIIAQECKGRAISKDSIAKRKSELRGFEYFTLRMRSVKDNEFFRTGMAMENEYYQRLEYFISGAQEDIKLVQGNDTIPCALYHFERNYGISPYSKIVVSFKKMDSLNQDDKIFIYDDKVLGVGKIAIKLNADELNVLPKLNI